MINRNYNVPSYVVYASCQSQINETQINGDDPINAWAIANNSAFGRKQYRFSGHFSKLFETSLGSYIRVFISRIFKTML